MVETKHYFRQNGLLYNSIRLHFSIQNSLRNSSGMGTVSMTIAERLKLIRGKETRESFSQKIGIHPQTLYRYEKGGREIDSGVIIAICEEYCISPAWLLTGSGSMHLEEVPSISMPHPEQAQPSETTSQTACSQCAELKAELEEERRERRELSAELREVNAELRRLARENKELAIENAELRKEKPEENLTISELRKRKIEGTLSPLDEQQNIPPSDRPQTRP